MSYYRQADGSIPVPPPDEEVITTPTLEDATLAPRRDMFEIVEEVISPNASAQPLTMTRNKNNPAQRRVVNKATQLATQPIATGKPAPAKSKKLSWNSLTQCHWMGQYVTKDGRLAYKRCALLQSTETMFCHEHSCRALLVDGSKCPNGILDPENPVCSGYHEENGRMELARMCPMKKAQQIADAKIARLQEFVDSIKWAAARWPELEKTEESHSSSNKGIMKLEEEIRQIRLASPAHRSLSLPSMSDALETAQSSQGPSRMLPPWFSADGRFFAAHAST